MSSNQVTTLIEQLGESFFLDTLEWTPRALRHAKSVGEISALWFGPIEEECETQGIYCPRSAFSFKTVARNIGNQGKSQPTVANPATMGAE